MRALQLVQDRRDALDAIAARLLEVETLERGELEELVRAAQRSGPALVPLAT